MARLWTDGAEMGDKLFWDADLYSNWDVPSSQKRSGTYSYHVNTGLGGGTPEVTKYLAAGVSEFYARVAFRFSGASWVWPFCWKNGGTLYGGIRCIQNNVLAIIVNGVDVAYGTHIVSPNTWYVIEIHVVIADSGSVTLKFEGLVEASYSGDTKPSTPTTIDRFSAKVQPDYTDIWIDDIAFNDTSGGSDNSWCGDGRVIILKPNGNGDSSQWTGSDGNSTDNYLLVDETPANGDTDYVEGDTVDEYDLYNLEASGLASNVTIKRVQVMARARDTVAAGAGIKLRVKTNSSEYTDSAEKNLLTTYTQDIRGDEYLVNPQTTSAWTVSELDALQAGPVVSTV